MVAEFQPIETAPKDGTVIGVWTDRQRPVIRIVRWGWHLNQVKSPPCWVTVSKGLAISRQPTHWIALGKLSWQDGDGVKENGNG